MVSPASFHILVGGPLVGGGGADRAVNQSLLQGVPVVGELDGRVGVDGKAVGLQVVVAGELEVVVQGLAVHGKLAERASAMALTPSLAVVWTK